MACMDYAISKEERGRDIFENASEASTGSGSRSLSLASLHEERPQDEYEMLRSQCSFSDWTVEIRRIPGKLGMQVLGTMGDSALGVIGVTPRGQVASWNAVHPCSHIRPGDVILEVNGISGDAKHLMHEILHSDSPFLALRLTRAVRFSAVLNCQQKHPGAGGSRTGFLEEHLRIVKVHESLVQRYKHVMPPELRIWPGDEVVMVNGRRSEADIRQQLAKAMHVELHLKRPAPGSSDAARTLTSDLPRKEQREETSFIPKSQSLWKAFQSASWPLGPERYFGGDSPPSPAVTQPLLAEC